MYSLKTLNLSDNHVIAKSFDSLMKKDFDDIFAENKKRKLVCTPKYYTQVEIRALFDKLSEDSYCPDEAFDQLLMDYINILNGHNIVDRTEPAMSYFADLAGTFSDALERTDNLELFEVFLFISVHDYISFREIIIEDALAFQYLRDEICELISMYNAFKKSNVSTNLKEISIGNIMMYTYYIFNLFPGVGYLGTESELKECIDLKNKAINVLKQLLVFGYADAYTNYDNSVSMNNFQSILLDDDDFQDYLNNTANGGDENE